MLEGLDDAGRHDLMEDVGVAYCEAVARWNRFSHQDVLVPWLSNLRGAAGDAMARAIHQSGRTNYFQGITRNERLSSPALSGLLEA